jgi:hypothetical protein
MNNGQLPFRATRRACGRSARLPPGTRTATWDFPRSGVEVGVGVGVEVEVEVGVGVGVEVEVEVEVGVG